MRDDFTDEESDRFERPIPPRAIRPRLIVLRSSAPPPRLELPRSGRRRLDAAGFALFLFVTLAGLAVAAVVMVR